MTFPRTSGLGNGERDNALQVVRESVRQVGPDCNPDYVMGPGDDVPRLASPTERKALGIVGKPAFASGAVIEEAITRHRRDQNTVHVYLSGPMSGIEDFNFPEFNRAAEALRGWGYTVFNPAEQGWGDGNPETGEVSPDEYNEFLREDIRQVTKADMVVVLDGWEKSNGASFEVDVARRLGIMVKQFIANVNAMGKLKYEGLEALEDSDVPSWAEERVVLDNIRTREDDPPDLCTCGPLTRADGWCDCGASEAAKRVVYASAMPARFVYDDDGESILEEADRLVSSDRGDQYGHPADDFAKVIGMSKALWGHGPETEEEHAIYMILVKIARLAHSYKRDSVVDVAGYAKTLSMVVEEKERRSGNVELPSG